MNVCCIPWLDILLLCCSGGPGQVDVPDRSRDSGTIRQVLRERVRPGVPPQLQPGRPAVEVLEEPAGQHGEWLWREKWGRKKKEWMETCDGVIEQSDGGKRKENELLVVEITGREFYTAASGRPSRSLTASAAPSGLSLFLSVSSSHSNWELPRASTEFWCQTLNRNRGKFSGYVFNLKTTNQQTMEQFRFNYLSF